MSIQFWDTEHQICSRLSVSVILIQGEVDVLTISSP